MKRIVKITIEVDPSEHEGCPDTPEGAVALAISMIARDADFPEKIHVASKDATGSYEETVHRDGWND